MEVQSTAVNSRFYWQRLRCAKRGNRGSLSLHCSGRAGLQARVQHSSSQILQEPGWLIVKARKHGVQVCVAEMARQCFAQHTAKIGGQRQIAAFIELRWIEARPASVNPSAAHRPTEDEHHIGVAVIGAAIAVSRAVRPNSDMVTTT